MKGYVGSSDRAVGVQQTEKGLGTTASLPVLTGLRIHINALQKKMTGGDKNTSSTSKITDHMAKKGTVTVLPLAEVLDNICSCQSVTLNLDRCDLSVKV